MVILTLQQVNISERFSIYVILYQETWTLGFSRTLFKLTYTVYKVKKIQNFRFYIPSASRDLPSSWRFEVGATPTNVVRLLLKAPFDLMRAMRFIQRHQKQGIFKRSFDWKGNEPKTTITTLSQRHDYLQKVHGENLQQNAPTIAANGTSQALIQIFRILKTYSR